MKKLKLGSNVIARFLGESFECEVIEVIDKDTYNLKTKQGTFLSSVQWKDKCEVNKKGKILSPWHIEKLNNDE
jgi:hypothetical protein